MYKDWNDIWWLDLGLPGEYVYGDDIFIDDWYMDERWRPVAGFEDRYWVSTHGRVWSYLENRFCYGSSCNRMGHIDLSLKGYNGERIHRYMHRLVAEAFIPNPHGYPEVLHGPDDDPRNNCVWNLRWGTQLDNAHDAIERGRFVYLTDESREKAMQKRRMPIIARNIVDGRELEFASQGDAGRALGIDRGEISAAIRGERRHINGWIFAKQRDRFDECSDIDIHYHAKLPYIVAENLSTGERVGYKGLTSAAKDLGLSIASVSLVLHGKQASAKGWYFKYADEEEYSE